MGKGNKTKMKKQNDSSKSKHYRIYNDSKSTQKRKQEAIAAIPERCWWIRQYFQGTFFQPTGRWYARGDKL